MLQGVWATGLMVAIMSWAARLRGPLFVSSFYPLILVTVAILGSLLLDEQLYLGRFELLFYFNLKSFIYSHINSLFIYGTA